MRNLIIAIMMMLPLVAFPQKKAQKEAKKKARHEQLMNLINSKTFVLEAYALRDRYGNQIFVNTNTNFVAVADSAAVLQIAFNNGMMGRNGLGGETIDGRITRFEVNDRGPGKGARVRMTFFGITAIDLFLDVSDNGRADIRLSGLRGRSIQYVGDLKPLQGADIYVGSTTF